MKTYVITTAALLMSVSAAAIELHTPHCLYGCPTGAPLTNDIIVRDNYTMSSNDFTKFADWVAYKVTEDTIGSGCQRNWKSDPLLDENETLEPDDYKDANTTLSTDRGHQVPLAAFCGSASWKETNYLSNITPQKSDLNQGPWKHLEDKVRDLAETGKIVYVLTGPVYDHVMPSMPKADEFHVVPSGYWKTVVIEDNGKPHVISFLFDQSASRGADYCSFRSDLLVIRKITGLTLLQNLNNSGLNISPNTDICTDN